MLRHPKIQPSDSSASGGPADHEPTVSASRGVHLSPGVQLTVDRIRNIFANGQRRQHEFERELRDRGRER